MRSQLKMGIVLSYVISIAQVVVQLLYTPMLLTILGRNEYGLYTLVGSIISYLSLCGLGFSGSYLRFYSRYNAQKDEDGVARLNGLFFTVYSVIAVVVIALGGILVINCQEILGNKISSGELQTAKTLMAVLVVNIAITFINTIFDSVIVAHEAYTFQRLVRLLSIMVNPLIALPLLLLGYRSVVLAVISTALSLLTLAVNIFYCFHVLHSRFIFGQFEWRLLAEISGFSFFIFLNMIIDQVNWNVDKFLLGRFCGTATVAIYGVASQINTMDINISTTVSSVFAPRIHRISASNASDIGFNELFVKVGRIQFMIMALMDSGIIFFGKAFICLWAGDEYIEAYYVVLCLVLPAIVPLIQNIGLEIQRAKNKHHFRSIIYFIMAIINVVVSIPLSRQFGAVGAAFGTTISLIVGNGMIMNWYYYKYMGIDIIQFFKNILSMIPAMIIPIILGMVIKLNVNILNWGTLIIWAIAYTIVFCICVWFGAMNEYEKNILLEFVRKIRKKAD